jgi:hypothetical protein
MFMLLMTAVNHCCACVAVQLHSDQCSFFFLFLGASLLFLHDSLSIESVFIDRFFGFCWGTFIPFLGSIFPDFL